MAKVHFIDLFAFLCSPMKLKLNFFQYVYWVHGFLLMRIWLFMAFVHLPFWGFVFFPHLFSLLWFSLVYDLSIYFDWLWGLLKVYYKRLYGMIRAIMEILMIPPQNFPPQALYEIEIVTLFLFCYLCANISIYVYANLSIFSVLFYLLFLSL